MFELSREENDVFLRSQNATLKRGAHSKYLPFVFTEHGVLILSKQGAQNSEDIQLIFTTLKQFLIPPEQANRRRIGFGQKDEQN
jgi:hypothetical protein